MLLIYLTTMELIAIILLGLHSRIKCQRMLGENTTWIGFNSPLLEGGIQMDRNLDMLYLFDVP